MKAFRLSDLAESDLADIWSYRADSGEERADALIERFVETFVMLATFREAGRQRLELGQGLRSFVMEGFVIFYRITDSDIEIIRVLHGSRDIENVFNEEAE